MQGFLTGDRKMVYISYYRDHGLGTLNSKHFVEENITNSAIAMLLKQTC